MDRNKWTSRKFWVMVIAAIYTIAAGAGFEVPVEQIIVVDALAGVWILVEGIIDAVKK